MIPNGSGLLGGRFLAKGVLDGWQVSGITTLRGGTRQGFTYAFEGAPANTATLTGGFGGSRPIIVCDPFLPAGERTFEHQFRTECIQPPGPLTDSTDVLYQGGAGAGTLDAWTGPGYVNNDLTLFKNFGIRGGRNIQFRFELYNLFNTTQYQNTNGTAAVDTSAVFDFQTGEQTDTNFGTVTGVRAGSERVMQLGFRFTF